MKTIISDNLGLEVKGYVINSGFSEENQKLIETIQNKLKNKFENSIWLFPQTSLHITLMDWFAPLVKYSEDPDVLFNRYKAEYEKVLTDILGEQDAIKIHFNTIEVSPTAIYLQGTDEGSYTRIRNKFLQKIELVSGTKKPPKIIHSTIARFDKEINLLEVKDFVASLNIDFYETVSKFRLIKETRVLMQEFEVIRMFGLND